MKKYLLGLAIIFMLFGCLSYEADAATPCTAEFSVVIRDSFGNIINDAQFSLYQEGLDANGMKKPVKQVVTGKIDPVLRWGKVKFNATTETMNYILKVSNPSLKNRDFLFYDTVTANCGYQGKAEVTLSTLRILVTDTMSNVIKNVPVSIGVQGSDMTNKTVVTETLGTYNTGTLGRVDVYVPSKDRSLPGSSNFYVVTAKNAKGLSFYQYNVQSLDNTVKYVEIKLSDALITVKDRATAQIMPNFKIAVLNQANSIYGGYGAGKQIDNIATDDQGRAYIQLPAGNYYLSYFNSNGEKINTPIEIIETKRHEFLVWLEDFQVTKCQYKSDLKLTFKDYSEKVVGNVNYNLYTQKLDPEGHPIAGTKAANGQIDEYGLSSTKFTSTPSQKYLLEACPQKTNGGCFWFANISFACSAKLALEKTIPAVTFILRETDDKLLIGQQFKVYQQTKDVDGRVIIDKDLLLGMFSLRAPGNFTMYLPSKDLKGWDQSYIITVDQKNKQMARAQFTVPDNDLTLDYVLSPGKMVLKNGGSSNGSADQGGVLNRPASNKLRGRILLQTESRGEAWYIHPVSGLRYFLGGAKEAYQVMKKVAYGMTNKDLAKIEPVVEDVTGADFDNDGLPDRLELALGTNYRQTDSDRDGYDDYEEAIGGFNPNGNGRIGFNQTFAAKYSGRILLQVEGRGEAWYVNPINKKRYYLGQPEDAYQLMRKLGLGATNATLDQISAGQ